MPYLSVGRPPMLGWPQVLPPRYGEEAHIDPCRDKNSRRGQREAVGPAVQRLSSRRWLGSQQGEKSQQQEGEEPAFHAGPPFWALLRPFNIRAYYTDNKQKVNVL